VKREKLHYSVSADHFDPILKIARKELSQDLCRIQYLTLTLTLIEGALEDL